jgi:hypothetical protein
MVAALAVFVLTLFLMMQLCFDYCKRIKRIKNTCLSILWRTGGVDAFSFEE